MEDGCFRVRPRSRLTGWSNVITLFLESLARRRRPAEVAVILSGMYADGAAALRDFHGKGGITIAQELTSADYPDMPRSAIQTGFMDYVLFPGEIARKLEEIVRERRQAQSAGGR